MVSGKKTKRMELVEHILTIGTYNYLHGDKYEGEWRNDEKNGKGKHSFNVIGVLTYSNGDKYEGEFSANKKNGKGVMQSADGEKYEGDWNDDRRAGIGK